MKTYKNLKIESLFLVILMLCILFTFSCSNKDEIEAENEIEIESEIENEEATETGEEETAPEQSINRFRVNDNYILCNTSPFIVKGMIYLPVYPGSLPWDIEKLSNDALSDDLKASILKDISNIKAMGANTVRFWGAPKYCYETLKEIGDLAIIQTIWIDTNRTDLHNLGFKSSTKATMEEVIDRIYSAFPNNDPPILAFIVGSEISTSSINSTNAMHPELTQYTGNYIKTDANLNATEVLIAEMADHCKTYEFETYGRSSLVTYANDIRSADLIDTPFLDFRTHNVYSYAIVPNKPGVTPGSSSQTLYQGWIEELKNRYPGKPLLIGETGLSVSPNAPHVGAPHYGYGGNTEQEQSDGILQNLQDIDTASKPIAGVCIHEYLDAWWKFSLEDSYTQDPNDVEEWFGVARMESLGDWYTTSFREVYNTIQMRWKEN